jgi:hypothetical protein
MTTQSNLYVEKVISEHPLAVWMLNDKLDYISYLTEPNRDIENPLSWSLTSCSVTSDPVTSSTPFMDSYASRISCDVPLLVPSKSEIESVYTIDYTLFDTDLATFSLGFYMYIDSSYISKVEYGYTYYDDITLINKEILFEKEISPSNLGSWMFFSNTYEIPIQSATNMKLLIKLTKEIGGGISDYDVVINGITLGQWSEDFHKTSLGIVTEQIPSTISLPNTIRCVEAKPYGLFGDSAYYLASESTLYSKNFGIPLVYGSSNVTKIYPNLQDEVLYPSIIFPGSGFLNDRGKYNEYTAECWITINTDSEDPVRIFGPISSTDGLYVESGFLTLVVGNKFGSHLIGEWFRPMLIHVKYSDKIASVSVNGEDVISFSIDQEDIVFPLEFDELGKSQDWIGLYANPKTYQISVDSFAIYSYLVPREVAKRRWVWGQGVSSPELLSSSNNSVTAFNDYAYSEYAANYNYPDFADWRQGFFSNINTSLKNISLPNYKLPDFYLDGFTTQEFYDAMLDIQDEEHPFFTFRPSEEWEDKNCYFQFNSLDFLNESIASIQGVFLLESEILSEQTIFTIIDNTTNDFIRVTVNDIIIGGSGEGPTLYYVFSIGENSQTFRVPITIGEKFAVGMDIETLSNNFPIQNISKFFSNPQNLTLRLGGGSGEFEGKIYNFGFSSSYANRRARNLNAYFDEGIMRQIPFNVDFLLSKDTRLSYLSSYLLVPVLKYGLFFADISAYGYWQDNIPLSYFGKYVVDYFGNETYRLDTIQSNFNFPAPVNIIDSEIIGSSSYSNLTAYLQSRSINSYEGIANNFYTGWDDYGDISEFVSKVKTYDTSNNPVRAYVTFQRLSDPGIKSLVDYNLGVSARASGIVNPDELASFYDIDGYVNEIVDGTIIYPPSLYKNNKPADFNDISMAYHVEFRSDGILHNPIKFKNIQFASQAFKQDDFTPVGTKFGTPVYQYIKRGIYYDFQSINPIATYKGSTPHLYLSMHTGWRIRGDFSIEYDRGLLMPINPQSLDGVNVSAIQMWIRYSEPNLPESPISIFSIEYKDGIYDFYLVEDPSQKRGKIFGLNRETGLAVEDISFSINGQTVDTPYILDKEWNVLHVSFNSLLDYHLFSGKINLNGPLTYNNVSYFTLSSLELEQSYDLLPWISLLSSSDWLEASEESWDHWYATQTTAFVLGDPAEVYDRYVGASRIIVDDNVDGILVDPEKIKVFSDVSWTSSTKSAV